MDIELQKLLRAGELVRSVEAENFKFQTLERNREFRTKRLPKLSNKQLGGMLGCTKRAAAKLRNKTLKGEVYWFGV